MKKVKRNLFSCIVAMCIALTAIPITANADNIVDSGIWGENITWEIRDTTLSINGEGAMDEIEGYINCYHNKFQNAPESLTEDYPWSKYYDVITDVVVAGGITSVAAGSFCYYPNLVNVVLPDSLEVIGANAFTCCKNLTEITIPENAVITADEMAGQSFGYYTSSYTTESGDYTHDLEEMAEFYEAENENESNYELVISGYDYSSSYYFCIAEDWICFNSIGTTSSPFIIPSGIVNDEITWTFSDLGTITFSGTGMIDVDALNEGCSDIMPYVRKVVFDDGITGVGKMAFSFFDFIEEVELSNSITEIGDFAFASSMNTMKSILIPESVISLGKVSVYTRTGSIYGYSDSAAEIYAADNSIRFITIDKIEQGDLNGDGDVNLTDATNVLSYYAQAAAGLDTEFDTNEQINELLIGIADMDDDSAVTLSDATEILTKYARKASGLE